MSCVFPLLPLPYMFVVLIFVHTYHPLSRVVASGKLSWEQVLQYARLRKKYISLYAALLKSDLDRPVVEDNEDIEDLDRELDIEIILQWRYLT